MWRGIVKMRMRMKMGRRMSRGLEQPVGRWGIRDLSRLLEEDILVYHHHHHQDRYIDLQTSYNDFRPQVSRPNSQILSVLSMHAVKQCRRASISLGASRSR
jgi:hypothetical protein